MPSFRLLELVACLELMDVELAVFTRTLSSLFKDDLYYMKVDIAPWR